MDRPGLCVCLLSFKLRGVVISTKGLSCERACAFAMTRQCAPCHLWGVHAPSCFAAWVCACVLAAASWMCLSGGSGGVVTWAAAGGVLADCMYVRCVHLQAVYMTSKAQTQVTSLCCRPHNITRVGGVLMLLQHDNNNRVCSSKPILVGFLCLMLLAVQAVGTTYQRAVCGSACTRVLLQHYQCGANACTCAACRGAIFHARHYDGACLLYRFCRCHAALPSCMQCAVALFLGNLHPLAGCRHANRVCRSS